MPILDSSLSQRSLNDGVTIVDAKGFPVPVANRGLRSLAPPPSYQAPPPKTQTLPAVLPPTTVQVTRSLEANNVCRSDETDECDR
jgi:hypothetical protein